MRFIRENGKFYVVDNDNWFIRKELTFRELTLAMADIAQLIEAHVTVTEHMETFAKGS